MDFKGTWKLRNGKIAVIDAPADDGVQFFGKVESFASPLSWDTQGNSHDNMELDIMERISGWERRK